MYCQPVATSEQLSKLTGLAVQTINKMVKILCADGILVEVTGNKRNRVFVLDDYLKVFD